MCGWALPPPLTSPALFSAPLCISRWLRLLAASWLSLQPWLWCHGEFPMIIWWGRRGHCQISEGVSLGWSWKSEGNLIMDRSWGCTNGGPYEVRDNLWFPEIDRDIYRDWLMSWLIYLRLGRLLSRSSESAVNDDCVRGCLSLMLVSQRTYILQKEAAMMVSCLMAASLSPGFYIQSGSSPSRVLCWGGSRSWCGNSQRQLTPASGSS